MKKIRIKFNFKKKKFRKTLTIFSILILVSVILTGGAIADRIFGIKPLDKFFPRKTSTVNLDRKILNEESVVINVAEEASPSVVTVSVETPKRRIFSIDPFGGFSQSIQGGEPQDIGTGFIVSKDGMIITNKHVVSISDAKYKVITKDNQEYEVTQISRDTSNDIALLKIDANDLIPLELGDSSDLKVGQFVVAIGTALGEFRHTITTGVISGLGRGITTGSIYEGYVEELNNVIQTDAAINYGNSGGPLLNSLGQVIGVNVAIASNAQNIGFAIPINTIKESLEIYQKEGRFIPKAFLGVRYQMIGLQVALLNNVPQGAYIVEVLEDSPAKDSGINVDDIITKFDNIDFSKDDMELSKIISGKKSGDKVDIEVWRNEEILKLSTNLSEAPQE
ncbi:S1C family serine protease [Patescibacteria group bacterium]